MGRLRIFVVVMTLLVGLTAAGPAAGAAITVPPGGTFFDDDGNIFEPDIEAIAAEGVTKGCNNEQTSFCPDRSVTRGQMAAFLVRALGLTAQDPAIDFTDDNESIFENDIEKLATAGITKGCGNANTFCPLSNVTRGQMAAFLTRGLEYERPVVAPRPQTINGELLDTLTPYLAAGGWCDGHNGEVCLTSIALNQGEFHLFEFWQAWPWSTLPTSAKNLYLSDAVRVEAYFNGSQLDLVESTSLEDDLMYKDYTFQFPAWLTGTHTIRVDYIDDTRLEVSSLIVTVNIAALSSSNQAPSAPGALSRPAGRLAFESN